jgi:Cu/Zn superoxide dismutase
MSKFQMPLLAGAAIAVSVFALPGFAETQQYTADLTAGAEVPPNNSTGTGTADLTVDTDTKMITWTITVEGLTGDPTAAHIHGPASASENAGPVINISDSIMEGSAEITDEQISDLDAGKYYLNLHTKQHPGGEIRGQIEAAE